MAYPIANYSDLTQALEDYLDRPALASFIPQFVANFEALVNRKVRHRKMVASTTLTTSSGSTTLPTDFIAVVDLFWSGSPPKAMVEWDDATFENQYGQLSTGLPSGYLIRGNNILIAPVDDTASRYTLIYYQKIPTLVTGSTNWLLTDHPDIYLTGCLAAAEEFQANPDEGGYWVPARDRLIDDLWRHGQFYRGPAPSMQKTGATP
jgi:hypothetical protein